MQIYFAIPPNSAFHGLLEEFFFIHQRYEIFNTLAINSLGKVKHFPTVPMLVSLNIPLHILEEAPYNQYHHKTDWEGGNDTY